MCIPVYAAINGEQVVRYIAWKRVWFHLVRWNQTHAISFTSECKKGMVA